MQPIFFSAVLKTEDGQTLETGVACVYADGSVVFKNEFVPLMRLGTKVQIARLLGGEEVQSFGGEVYLSSPTLLKITAVDPRMIDEAQRIFGANTSVVVKLALKDSHEPNYRAGDIIDGTVYYLSPDLVKLMSMEQIEPGHRLMLKLKSPVQTGKLSLEVQERVTIGRIATGYLCRVVGPLSRKVQSALADYETQSRQENAETDSPV